LLDDVIFSKNDTFKLKINIVMLFFSIYKNLVILIMRSLLLLSTLFALASISEAQPIENNETQGAVCWE